MEERSRVLQKLSATEANSHRMSSFVSCVCLHALPLAYSGGTLIFFFIQKKKIGGVGSGKLEREVTLALQFGNVIL